MKVRKPLYVSNSIRTPDGTVLRSRYASDFQTHVDKNGKIYTIDGGLSKLRRKIDVDAMYEELSVSIDAPFEKIREAMEWGTYGKNRSKTLQYVKLKDMSDEHLKNAIVHLKNHAHAKEKALRSGMTTWSRVFTAFLTTFNLSDPRMWAAQSKLWTVEYMKKELDYRKKMGLSIADTPLVHTNR